jgi:futalosine hydrolase
LTREVTQRRTLFVAATSVESEPLVSHFCGSNPVLYGPPVALHDEIDIVITGIGGGATGLSLGRWMNPNRYDVAYHFGVCGSFHDHLPIGAVVRIGADRYADLGAETQDEPIDLFQMGLLGESDWPYEQGRIRGSSSPSSIVASIPHVEGVTVHRVLSRSDSIEHIRRRYSPDVVTMESAAFLFACRILGVTGFELRCVSDLVGPRDKSKWRISEAVMGMTEAMKMIAAASPNDRRPLPSP